MQEHPLASGLLRQHKVVNFPSVFALPYQGSRLCKASWPSRSAHARDRRERRCRSNPPLSAKKAAGHEGDCDPPGLLGFTPRFALRSASSAAGGHPPSADRLSRSRVFALPYPRAAVVRIPHSPPKKPPFGGLFGGEWGIRTPERLAPLHAFQACSLNHSDNSPGRGAPWAQGISKLTRGQGASKDGFSGRPRLA